MFGRDSISRMDIPLIVAVIVTVAFGILMIYSAGFDPIDKINSGLYKKQILWFIVGMIFLVMLSIFNYKQLGDYGLYIYGGIFFILILTTLFSRPIRGTSAWLSFGVISIQPSEFMKLGTVILLAKYLELKERDISKFRELLIPTLIVFIPVLVILKQPDFGTAGIFIPVLFTMLFVAGADISHLIAIISTASIALIFPMIITYREWAGYTGSNAIVNLFVNLDILFTVAGIIMVIAAAAFAAHYFLKKAIFRRIYIPASVFSLGLMLSVVIQKLFKTYQKKRILVFLNPDLDPHGSGYNIIQSKIAIGSGGIAGKGFLQGTQSQLGFLPEKTTDFVFSVVAEEFGLIGSLVLLGLLGFIVFRGIQIALSTKDKYGALLATGITSILFFHILINIGMVIGIMPVTGLPLCFVSYGGSNLFMAMMAMGILNSISMNRSTI